MSSLRIAIEVVGGILPGTPIPQYTKQWVITSVEWYGPKRDDICQERIKAAEEYARSLMNPAALNWVRTDWIYF